MATTTKRLGIVPVNRGTYNANEDYYMDNVVQWKNCSYYCKVDGPVRGVEPGTEDVKWGLWAGIPVVQELGDSEKEVVSQKVVSNELKYLNLNVGNQILKLSQGSIDPNNGVLLSSMDRIRSDYFYSPIDFTLNDGYTQFSTTYYYDKNNNFLGHTLSKDVNKARIVIKHINDSPILPTESVFNKISVLNNYGLYSCISDKLDKEEVPNIIEDIMYSIGILQLLDSRKNDNGIVNMNTIFDNNTDIKYFPTCNIRVKECDGAFRNSTLQYINMQNFIFENDSTIRWMFSKSKVQSIKFPNASVHIKSIRCLFYDNSSIKEVDLGGIDTLNTTDVNGIFYNCEKLTNVKFKILDVGLSTVTTTPNFNRCFQLTNVEGDIINIMEDCFGLRSSDKLTRDSVMVFIYGLHDYLGTGSTIKKTLTLHSIAKSHLTPEDIAIASAKGWTIA